MNTQKVAFALITLIALAASSTTEARRYYRRNHYHHRGSSIGSALGFLAGALTGATLAHSYDSCYYRNMPTYDMVYRGAPLLAYDYPTYAYSPMYAYPGTLYTYPGYYFSY